MQKNIVVKGAREHNLKNISLEIPRDQLVVITGLSGSGKSSLVFDTIYAEGRRRYVESLSTYARQFLGEIEKPDVERIEGLSPAIAIDERSIYSSPRSTVGTITEIYDYMRLLYARIGIPHCPICGKKIAKQTIPFIVERILKIASGKKAMILAPLVMGRTGTHRGVFKNIQKNGFVRVRVDGTVYELSEIPNLDRKKEHNIEVVVDRVEVGEKNRVRIIEAVEVSSRLSGGLVYLKIRDGKEYKFSEFFACSDCGINLTELEPRSFSFNSPHGACPVCTGLGTIKKVIPELVIPNKKLSLSEGAIFPWSKTHSSYSWHTKILKTVAEKYEFSPDEPVKNLSPEVIDIVLYGTKDDEVLVTKYKGKKSGKEMEYDFQYEGVIPGLERRYRETDSDSVRNRIEKYMKEVVCENCQGQRLKKTSLGVTVGDLSIAESSDLSLDNYAVWIQGLPSKLSGIEKKIAKTILQEINSRVEFLEKVGLSYLTISRSAATLSSGETQRIKLATQLGASLVGVLYVLDEPSVGLHARDNERLLEALRDLADMGNTVLVIEHDLETIKVADHILDMGPGAGENGGEVVAQGNLEDILASPKSITAKYINGKEKINIPERRKIFPQNDLLADHSYLEVIGAKEHNLKNINVNIPLNRFVCITGVSGSGKSSLIEDIVCSNLTQHIYGSKREPGQVEEILGIENLDRVIEIDQSPIGRTPRSNVATYTGFFKYIRDLFSKVPEACMRGYDQGRFSFNVKGGRCEHCAGKGQIEIEMHFLPDVCVECEECHGRRYNKETLAIKYKGKTIAEVLDMTVEEALEFFKNISIIKKRLKTLKEVGLGYIRLGQTAPTLSGGEAQRVKLSSELCKRSTNKTLYFLDEPTTGLHLADVAKLLDVIQKLVENGSSVIVIEHNLDVIKCADYIIDLGPEGGAQGGEIVGTGTPEEIARVDISYTGQFLKRIFDSNKE